jgi:glycosyltransferase involved in cell wall biosynthesis
MFSPGTDPKAIQRMLILNRLQMARQAELTGNIPWKIQSNLSYAAAQPCVSVIISLYNYQNYILECLNSVESSNLADLSGPIEILVIDDGSNDGSVEVVETFLARTNLPMALITKFYNTGLADVRNLGLKLARASYCFILDADNWIYPNCLARLYHAIANTEYAAVYNLIVRFDDQTGEKLDFLSQFEWDRRELVRRPYIDAMALFNRNILLKVGGYLTELVEHGWFGLEDYELWLRLAQAGYDARLVPQVLSAYRLHSSSMLNTTNLYAIKLNNYFGQKFARLLNEYSDLDQYFGFPPEYQGYLDLITQEYIRGWIWNKYLQNNPVQLNIYDYDELIATITANKFRLDIFEEGKGNGSYGFLFLLPDRFHDGEPHLIRVKVAGKSYELNGSPYLFTSNQAHGII